jgi:hypothetical protein
MSLSDEAKKLMEAFSFSTKKMLYFQATILARDKIINRINHVTFSSISN